MNPGSFPDMARDGVKAFMLIQVLNSQCGSATVVLVYLGLEEDGGVYNMPSNNAMFMCQGSLKKDMDGSVGLAKWSD